ncbi:MAG: hypothetical protein IKZ87_02210, partial [Actinomycetaceae bacterium]|nr:hypothetical protein [Actinomycetaceae bacterium]
MTDTGKKLSKKSIVITSVIAVLAIIGGSIFGYITYAKNSAESDYSKAYTELVKAHKDGTAVYAKTSDAELTYMEGFAD